ncbi:TPA: amino acid permease [Salmonella enterica]|nr:amino acid permease [Salmonella enterica subsp. enterica serovar 4,5:i:-]
MSSDADAHKVGLIPVTLMVSGNIMGSGVFLLPANLAATGGIAIYGWLVTIIGALALSMVYAKMSSLDPSPGGSYAYARRCFGPFLGYQTNVLYWLACWIGNIAMVVIGVGYLSYFFPILKDPLVLTLTCVAVLWIFVLLNIVGPKMITRVQAVATVLALGDTAGAIVSFCAAAGCLGSLGGWTLLAGQTAKAAADDGLFPPIFARVNKAGTPVAGLLIVGVLMTIFQFSSMSPNAAKEFGLVSSVSVIFTLVPYLYTCAALLLLGHGHFGKARPLYLLITFVAFVYCIWAVIGSGAKEVMWSFVTLMVITALYALNYNRIHKNPYPLDAPVKQD